MLPKQPDRSHPIAVAVAFVFVIVINLAALVATVWLIVVVLRWLGVLA